MQVALSVFNIEWSAVTLVSSDRQMYVANAKGTKVLLHLPIPAPFLRRANVRRCSSRLSRSSVTPEGLAAKLQ